MTDGGEETLVSSDSKQPKKEEMNETHQLVERNLRSARVEEEPPSVAKDGCTPDVGANDHVSEEEPLAHEWFPAVSRWVTHDRMVWRVEAQCSRGKAVGDKVDPEKLDGDESLRHAEEHSEEDGDDFANVGRD